MKTLLLTLCLCFVTPPAWAAVAVDSCTHFEGAGQANMDTTVHTVGAGANYLVVFVGTDSDVATSAITSVTWDFGGTAQAMGSVSDNAGTGVVMGAAYTLLNPTLGNKTLRVVNTVGTGCCDIKLCSFSGVDSVTPLGTIVENESTGVVAGDSLAFTVNTGGMALAYLVTQGPHASFAQGANQTQQQRATASCNAGDCDGTTTTATVSPMDYTWTSTGTDFWHVVLPINAAAGRRPIVPIIY